MQYGFDDITYTLKLLWQLPSQITSCLGSWRTAEKIVRKTLTIVNTQELGKNVLVNLFFRGGTLATLSWEMVLGLFGNNPFRVGAGLGGYFNQLLF